MATHQQCLLFFLKEDRPTDYEEPGPSTSSASGPSSSKGVLTFFILLPRVYLERHPDVERFLQSKDVNVLDETNVNRLLVDGLMIEVIEIFLDDRSSASVDALKVLSPLRVWVKLKSLHGDKIRKIWRYQGINRKYSKSMLDDFNSAVIKRLAVARLIITYHLNAFIHVRGTLLHLAATSGDVETASLLVQTGADVNSTLGAPHGRTPLHFAALPPYSPEMTQFLIEQGADVHIRDSRGWPPLQLEVEYSYRLGYYNAADRLAVVKLLLDYGAPLIYRRLSNDHPILELYFDYPELEEFKYLLARCFVQAQSFQDDSIFRGFMEFMNLERVGGKETFSAFCYHLQKIDTLEEHLNSNAHCRLVNKVAYAFSRISDLSIPKFAEECEAEITLLKERTLGNTNVSLLELLGKKEEEVAILLRNKSVDDIAESHQLATQFPIYGNILDCHLAKGVFRKSIPADGIKCFCLLSKGFRALPEEIQETVVSYLSLQDVLLLKRATLCLGT